MWRDRPVRLPLATTTGGTRPRVARPVVVVAALTAAGSVVAACGSGAAPGGLPYRRADVERFLGAEVARTSPGRSVGAVTCPDDLPAAVGAEARCSVEVDGVVLTYVVQRLAGQRLEARPAEVIVDLAQVARQLEAKIGGDGTSATCGRAAVTQLPPGQQISCTVTTTTGDRTAVITVQDGRVVVTET